MEQPLGNVTLKFKSLILNSMTKPTLFRECINDWAIIRWDLMDWSSRIGSRMLPFRVGTKKFSQQPQWEGDCSTKDLSLEEFHAAVNSDCFNQEWYYFDYKHMIEWFKENPDILECVNWSNLGFPERGGHDSTLWISSEGAHTPCHIDTYGCNLVAQVYGRKQWILFPPDCKALKPTRVPYEESSIYSEINFYSPPEDLRLQGAHVVDLEPGDVLFVPAGWWHYVETISPAAISINTWIPLPGDDLKQIEEAIVKTWVASLSHLTPSFTTLLNPNETEIKQDKNILEYLRRALNQYDKAMPQEPSAKRSCILEDTSKCSHSEPSNEDPCFECVKESCCALNIDMKRVSEMTQEQFLALLEQKRLKFDITDDLKLTLDKDLELCKKLINIVCCDKQILSLITTKLLE